MRFDGGDTVRVNTFRVDMHVREVSAENGGRIGCVRIRHRSQNIANWPSHSVGRAECQNGFN